MANSKLFPTMLTVDGKERVRDFLAQHGGRSARDEHEGDSDNGARGWSEVYAADGYVLRCDWIVDGGTTHMRFSETAP